MTQVTPGTNRYLRGNPWAQGQSLCEGHAQWALECRWLERGQYSWLYPSGRFKQPARACCQPSHTGLWLTMTKFSHPHKRYTLAKAAGIKYLSAKDHMLRPHPFVVTVGFPIKLTHGYSHKMRILSNNLSESSCTDEKLTAIPCGWDGMGRWGKGSILEMWPMGFHYYRYVLYVFCHILF